MTKVRTTDIIIFKLIETIWMIETYTDYQEPEYQEGLKKIKDAIQAIEKTRSLTQKTK